MMILVIFFFQAEDGIRDLYVTGVQTCALPISDRPELPQARRPACRLPLRRAEGLPDREQPAGRPRQRDQDRKSTRLNSSHVEISYAVFCLKKKKKKNKKRNRPRKQITKIHQRD